jgi:hypothetical protein
MRAPRWAGLLLAAGCVAGLHAAAGWSLAVALQGPHAAAAAARPARLQWVALPPLPTAPAVAPSQPAHEAGDTGAATAQTPLPAQHTLPDSAAAQPFLRTPEVDEPARPLPDWVLDGDALAALGIERVVFHAWVDAQGQWAQLQVTEIEPAEQRDLAPLIEARLRQTPMAPALRHGQPVAHQQRIELQLAPPVPGSG